MNAMLEVKSVVDAVADDPANESALIVAFASLDGDCIDQHFGSSQGFFVYHVDADNATLIAKKDFPKALKDGNEDKLKPRLAWLHGCDLVYCGSIGGSATKQLIALGVHPRVVKEGPDIEEIIEEIQTEFKNGLSPMTERILQNKKPKSDGRFDDFGEDFWEE